MNPVERLTLGVALLYLAAALTWWLLLSRAIR